MKPLIDQIISNPAKRALLPVAAVIVAVFGATACAVQETNTYPIEIFSEMHYSQSTRMQEPPALGSRRRCGPVPSDRH